MLSTTTMLHTKEYRGDHDKEIALPVRPSDEAVQNVIDAALRAHHRDKFYIGDRIVIYIGKYVDEAKEGGGR